jgi:hypothetical protein
MAAGTCGKLQGGAIAGGPTARTQIRGGQKLGSRDSSTKMVAPGGWIG